MSARTDNQREAERKAALLEKELREGKHANPGKMRWQDFVLRHKEEVQPGLAQNTRRMFSTVFHAVEKHISPTRLADLTASRLSYLAAELRKAMKSEATIQSYLAHLRSALTWAVDVGLLPTLPKFPKVQRAKGQRLAKGRGVLLEEFERMIHVVPRVLAGEGRRPKGKTRKPDAQPKSDRREVVGNNLEVNSAAVASWRFLLSGLWWGGLRLGEALNLDWNRQDKLQVELSGKRPMIRIPAELEKGNQERLSPMAPEFFRLLETVPNESRRGRVFKLIGASGKTAPMGLEYVSEVIGRVGRLAGVKVHVHPRTGKVKYASAHDLRRSFCERWAMKVMPQVLTQVTELRELIR